MTLTPKLQAAISGIISGLTGFVSWLATVPPETQANWLGQIVNACPVVWRPDIGLAAKALSTAMGIYALYQASKSGPHTPPATDTVTGKPTAK